jgi:hypothetical protein
MSESSLNSGMEIMLTKAEMIMAADRYRNWFGLEGWQELTTLIVKARHPSELAHAARQIGDARRAAKP